MKAYHFDAKTGKEIYPVKVSGLVGFTSWRRLGKIFQDAKELLPNEEILSFKVDESGIRYFIRTKK